MMCHPTTIPSPASDLKTLSMGSFLDGFWKHSTWHALLAANAFEDDTRVDLSGDFKQSAELILHAAFFFSLRRPSALPILMTRGLVGEKVQSRLTIRSARSS